MGVCYGTPQVYPSRSSKGRPMTTSATLEYSVPGMSCEHCRSAVTEEVAAVDGVAAVDVDLTTKRVRVHGTALAPDAVVAAIDRAGYDAEPA